MKQMMRVLCIAMVAGLALAGTASANIVMSWAPWHVGEPGAAGDWLLFADIQESESIVGWGLDIYWNGPITAAVHAYGPAWDVS
ncbi:MAG TPA: hypothetical protein VMV94_02960, partial [Phycisphaerae bacterium]|nr:hypothetical protein [Phycisphaerae bacterium]